MASFWTRRVMGVAIVFATFLTCIPAFAQTGGLTGKCTGTEARRWRAIRSRLSAPKSNGFACQDQQEGRVHVYWLGARAVQSHAPKP